jgi:hypothetical protein
MLGAEAADPASTVDQSVSLARDAGLLRPGDRVVVVFGSRTESLATNTLRVLTVP